MARRFSYESMTPPEQAIWCEFFPEKADRFSVSLFSLLAEVLDGQIWQVTARGLFAFDEIVHLEPRRYSRYLPASKQNELTLLEALCGFLDRFGGEYGEAPPAKTHWEFLGEFPPLLQMAGVQYYWWNFERVPQLRLNYGFYMGDTLPFGEHFLRATQAMIRALFREKLEEELVDVDGLVGDYLTMWGAEDSWQLYTNDRGVLRWIVSPHNPDRTIEPVVEVRIMGIELWEETDRYQQIEQDHIERFLEEYDAEIEEFDAWEHRDSILREYLESEWGNHFSDIFGALVADMNQRTMMEVHL